MDAVLVLLGSVKFGGKPLSAMQQRALAAAASGHQYDLGQVVVRPGEADRDGLCVVVAGSVLLQGPGEPLAAVAA